MQRHASSGNGIQNYVRNLSPRIYYGLHKESELVQKVELVNIQIHKHRNQAHYHENGEFVGFINCRHLGMSMSNEKMAVLGAGQMME